MWDEHRVEDQDYVYSVYTHMYIPLSQTVAMTMESEHAANIQTCTGKLIYELWVWMGTIHCQSSLYLCHWLTHSCPVWEHFNYIQMLKRSHNRLEQESAQYRYGELGWWTVPASTSRLPVLYLATCICRFVVPNIHRRIKLLELPVNDLRDNEWCLRNHLPTQTGSFILLTVELQVVHICYWLVSISDYSHYMVPKQFQSGQ